MAAPARAMYPNPESALSIRIGPPNDWIKSTLDLVAQRAFAIFEYKGRPFGSELSDWFQAEHEVLHSAHLEIVESDRGFTVYAEVPGFEPKELDINIDGRRLTIAGKRERQRQNKEGKTLYSESCSDHVLRVIDLSSDVNAEAAKGNVKDGVLELTLPKATPSTKTSQ